MGPLEQSGGPFCIRLDAVTAPRDMRFSQAGEE